jgi:hypothetical protein
MTRHNVRKMIRKAPSHDRYKAAAAPLEFDPTKFAGVYGARCVGDCLMPVIADGSTVVFTADEPARRGDFVVVYRRPEFTPAGSMPAIMKRLVFDIPGPVKFPWTEHPDSEIAFLLTLEYLNPRRRIYVPCAHILAVHKAIGLAPPEHPLGQPLRFAEVILFPKAPGSAASIGRQS